MKKTLLAAATMVMLLAGCKEQPQYPVLIANEDTAVVPTASGTVRGYYEDGVFIFKGLPYAVAERFMPPTPVPAWEGVRSCLYYGAQAPQGTRSGWKNDPEAFVYRWDDGTQSEQCQYLNIWTKNINNNEKKPVMVWLHGGGYSGGASSELPMYDGLNLAKKDVVLVSINHRLNNLGFLDLSAFGEKYKYSGNAGVLDMIASLQWVKENIANFGGDPDNVTIFGQSGGGGKVSILLDSPMAKGLIHRGIVESGSMMGITTPEYSVPFGVEVAKQLGLNEKTIDKIQEVPYAELSEAVSKATKIFAETGRYGGANPVMDGEVIKYPLHDSRIGEISGDVPVIIGHNVAENTQFTSRRSTLKGGASMVGNSLRDLVVEEATAAYNAGGAKEYIYLFGKKSPIYDGAMASNHCTELSYVFNNIYLGRHMVGSEPSAYVLAEKMSDMWVAFAKTGDPSTKKYKWEPFNPETEPTMYFDDDLRMIDKNDAVIDKMMNNPEPKRGY